MPYLSWKYSHKFHHNNTCNVNRDEVFIPKKKKEIVAAAGGGWGVTKYLQHPLGRILMIAFMLMLGWPFYMIYNVSRRKYPRSLLLILISKSWGGVSPALLSAGAVFLLEVFSQASSQQHNAYYRKGNVK